MNTNATSGQEASESVDEQRTRWERMSMTVLDGEGAGYVNVRNDSHGDDAGAHIYSVEVKDGAATGCSCPHAVHRGAHCKHQVAVEDRPLVVSSATAAAASGARIATDGGEPVEQADDTEAADPCDECGEDMSGRFLAPAGPDADVCIMCDETETDTDAAVNGVGFQTATGWGTSEYRAPADEDEDVDRTPL